MHRRVKLEVQTGSNPIKSQIQDASGNWIPLGGFLQPPDGMELCEVKQGPILTAPGTITCPIAGTSEIDFTTDNSTCGRFLACTTVLNGTAVAAPTGGATFYYRTIDTRKQYKLVIYGLTGQARVADQW
jgi:hypothetical protein